MKGTATARMLCQTSGTPGSGMVRPNREKPIAGKNKTPSGGKAFFLVFMGAAFVPGTPKRWGSACRADSLRRWCPRTDPKPEPRLKLSAELFLQRVGKLDPAVAFLQFFQKCRIPQGVERQGMDDMALGVIHQIVDPVVHAREQPSAGPEHPEAFLHTGSTSSM